MKKNIINKTLSIIMDIIFIILLGSIVKLGMIPNKYLFIVIIILLLVGIIATILAFKLKSIIFKIILAIFIIILSIGSSLGIYYITTTNHLFTNMSESTEKSIYYVIVKKDSNYSKLKDLNKKNMAVLNNKSKNYDKALTEVSKQIKVKNISYDDMNNMVKDLLSNKVDSLLINSNNKDILDETMSLFKENTKILEEISIDVIKQKEKEYKNKYGPFNILISGIDTNGDINTVARSDVNIIMTVNPNNHEVLLTNIPRDTEVKLHNTTGITDKLTHAGMYGIDMSRQTIEDFLDIEIPYYVRLNFDSLVRVVDAIGGIDINNDMAFKGVTRYFAVGPLHLNGKQALEYSRERKKLEGGDWTRGLHQEEVIRAIITKVTTSKELLTNYSELVEGLKDLFQTNIPEATIKRYIKNQLDTMASWQIDSTAVKIYDGAYQETYSMPGMNLYISKPDPESINTLSKIINSMLNDKKYADLKIKYAKQQES